MMNTTTWSILNCTTVTYPNVAIIAESDIVISNGFNWFTGLGNTLPDSRPDFYAGILHEIGHALGLGHSLDFILANNESNIMYYHSSFGTAGTGTSALDRRSLTSGGSLSLNSELNYVITPSRQTNLNNSGCFDLNALTTRNVSSPSISPSGSTLCSNSAITLTSSTNNGSGPGYTVSNQWSTTPVQTTQSIVVTPRNYTLTVTQSNLSGPPNTCTSIATVETLLPSVINTQPITQFYSCNGSNVDIDIDAPFGSTFQWERSNNGIDWVKLIDDFIYYMGVKSDQLNIIFANVNYGYNQYYRCNVKNGPNYCELESDYARLEIRNVTLAPFTPVFTGDPFFQLTGGWPPGGSYSCNNPNNFTCNDPPDCFDCTYHPPAINSTPLNPPLDIISYRIDGCLPDPSSEQIQIIYCVSTPPCDAMYPSDQPHIIADKDKKTNQFREGVRGVC